jgi:hypothetical protein
MREAGVTQISDGLVSTIFCDGFLSHRTPQNLRDFKKPVHRGGRMMKPLVEGKKPTDFCPRLAYPWGI